MKYLLNRLKERSTWLGLVAIAAAFGLTISPELLDYIIAAGMAVAGIVGVVTSDKNAGDGKEEK